MKRRFLIVGAGMTGLAFANFVDDDDYLILERENEIGGWCKTVHQDGFVWDYSGHFFHFRHAEIEQYLRDRMPADEVVTVVKDSRIHFKGELVDFPFQKNIHQLPREDFIECLYDLYFRDETAAEADPASFKGMLYEKFGRGIAEKFLIPYNEKLYACDLELLDRDAMGRFFPYADVEDVIRNMRRPDNASYNATFTYPRGGAIQYVRALASEVPDDRIALGTALVDVDLGRRVATTDGGDEIEFEYLISSAPFDRLMAMTDLEYDPGALTSNKVLVFNLGFDSKGYEGIHWVYFPERDYCFYRVGFYDNILGQPRMSLYVEVGLPTSAPIDEEGTLARVLRDLENAGVVDGQQLVSHHSVVLDPAYVHINTESRTLHESASRILATRGVYSIGRYGGWTYCSIEDNIVEARELAARFNAVT
jgi:protoporphyrinogen oxidase